MASYIINSNWWNYLHEVLGSTIDPFWWNYIKDVLGSPLTVLAAGVFAFYLIYRSRVNTYDDSDDDEFPDNEMPELPLFEKDMGLEELALYNSKREDGRFLIALKGYIFDVSSASDDFGPEGVYETLTGTNIIDHIYHLADEYGISATDHVNEWYDQLEMNFPIVGTLLDAKPDNDEQKKDGAKNSAVPKKEKVDAKDESVNFDVHNDTPYPIHDDNDVTITDAA